MLTDLLRALAQIYASLTPAIGAAVAAMVFTKTPWLRGPAWGPLDGGRCWRDGRRIFGDNKTRKGLLALVVLGILSGLVWGWLGNHTAIGRYNLTLLAHPSTALWNGFVGGLLGLTYGLFELPNSFLKRRFGIRPGHTHQGRGRWAFVVLDQIDSVLGLALVLALLAPISATMVGGIVVVGGLTHLVINLGLFALKLRRHPL